MIKNRLQFFRKFILPEDEAIKMKFLSEVPLYMSSSNVTAVTVTVVTKIGFFFVFPIG